MFKDVEAPNAYRVWIPGAENIHETEDIRMKTRGEYTNGFPNGLVIHWTAGWMLNKGIFLKPYPFTNLSVQYKKMARKYALSTARRGAKNGYNFLVMDVFGKVYQSRPLNKHGYHAGKSFWPSVGHSVSNDFAGVEVLNPGKLTFKDGKYFTWYKQEIPNELVRYVTNKNYGVEGHFCKFTLEQEQGLITLAKDMIDMAPSEHTFNIDDVVGHHEVSPDRKTDPGGSLSVNMDIFRKQIFESKNIY
jgi:hypothetical protein